MKVQDICKKHYISHKNVLKHCQRGRFILDGIVYEAKDVSSPLVINNTGKPTSPAT